MSITTEIERLQAARNKLRTKGIELGITNGTAKLDEIAEAFDDIVDQGDISAEVKEGETFTIPAGYHSGSGTVAGVAGGGNYKLQSKTVTPTKKQLSITPDTGNYGLSDVIVQAIPDMYQDVTPVTAGAGDVLATKVIVNALGQTVAGTMPNNGAVAPDPLAAGEFYSIPEGYHKGGKVEAKDLASQTAGDAEAEHILNGRTAWVNGERVRGTMQQVIATIRTVKAGEVVLIEKGYHNGNGKVEGASIASQTSATASASEILSGKTAWVDGVKLSGSMPNNGAQTGTVNADASVTISKGYHDGTGKITGASLASQTPATATARMIVDGATAWVNGELVTGELPEKMWAGGEKVLAAGESVTYGWGVYFNDMTVTAKDLASQTDGDAAAGQILSGKIAWVDGVKLTGSMPNQGTKTLTIDGLTSTSVSLPAGYYSGGSVSLTGDIEAALAAV